MELFDVIKTRRSIRKYRTDPVSDGDINAILDAARLAPSWKNNQCWRFIVVRDSAIKENLASTIIMPNKGAAALRQAPVAIVACAELGLSGIKEGKNETDKGDWFMFDVALAMQNLVLAAWARGLGTVHIGLFDAKKAAAILDVPPGYCVVEITPLGYPDESPEPRPRKTPEEIIFYEKFGEHAHLK